MAGPDPVVEIRNLRKTYPGPQGSGTRTVAVEDVSLTVRQGEIFGVLGPNGAGKTTTVECLAGLRQADGGTVRVLGVDPQADPAAVRDVVGVQLQEAALNEKITVEEAMRLFASFYASPGDVEELLDLLDLAPHRRVAFAKLSGGQKQRLSIALALVGNPRVAILDELTTGLDPAARRATWELVERVRDRGVTILLVTHFMDEAERLCDRLVIIDRGRVVAQGTPAELVDSVDTSRTVRLRVPPADHDLALHTIAGLADVQHVEAAPGAGREIEVTGSRRVLPAVVLALAEREVVPDDVRTVSRTLRGRVRGRDRPHLRPGRDRRPADPRGVPMTATTLTPSAAPVRRSSGWRGFGVLLATESRLWLRDPGTVFFALVFPTVLLVGVGFAIPGMRVPIEDAPPPWGGLTPVALYAPVVLAAAIATPALTTMPVYFATFREKGLLRRLSTTPMRPQGIVVAHLVINLVAVVVASAVALVVGQLVFGLPAPRNAGTVVLAFVLGVASMYALGTLVAARAPKASTASAIGTLIYFPLLFLSGLWTPGPMMPEAVAQVGRFTPLGAASQAMTAGWFEEGFPRCRWSSWPCGRPCSCRSASGCSAGAEAGPTTVPGARHRPGRRPAHRPVPAGVARGAPLA